MNLPCMIVMATISIANFARAESEIPLWPDGAPGALGTAPKDISTITPFLATGTNASGAAMVILPGGAYAMLAGHEGKGYADWLVTNGITCFVVKYRLGTSGYRHPRMLEDAARAVRTVRARAEEWKIDPQRVGIMGSSAGGHLASTLLTHFDAGIPDAKDSIDKQSSRPNLGILCYPVISMGKNTHQGSKNNLLGDKPADELVEALSNELQVTKNTPPCFIWHTWEDKAVKVENSLEFAMALQRAGVPYDLHVYQKGPHGIGLGKNHPWANDCIFWLKAQKFVK
ncbi:MAG TPA: alpha/beta hydrolase [Verrucomicrobiae bacterium]